MEKYLVYLFFFIYPTCITAQMPHADKITGFWVTEKKECVVEIYKKGDLYFGKMVWLKEPLDEKGNPKKDIKNPDPSLRNQTLKGMTFMYNFQYEGNDKWVNGRIYNAEDGRIYNAQITMLNNNEISIRGYIGMPCFGMSTTWKRKTE